MKAFEKWCDRQIFCDARSYEEAEIVWKAALKWVLYKMKSERKSAQYKFDFLFGFQKTIEEELNEKDNN